MHRLMEGPISALGGDGKGEPSCWECNMITVRGTLHTALVMSTTATPKSVFWLLFACYKENRSDIVPS